MVVNSTTMQFSPGQRWLSETEMEQGLGIVTQVQGRTVSLMFPVTGEVRHYAMSNAPLARYQLLVDEIGQHGEGWSFRVLEVTEQQGVVSYRAIRTDTGEQVDIPEAFLAAQVATNHPLTRLLAGKVDRLDMYELRLKAQQYLQRWQQSPAAGLIGARAERLPHQLYLAATIADRFQPRVLLADEVGLGKTIEAALIIHRRLLSGSSSRVLIVVPDSLAHQWLVELLRRFNLSFSLFDVERCEQAALDGGPLFATEQLVIIPQSLLSHGQWSAELFAVTWDLLVVDEAHQLRPQTEQFELLRQLCEQIPSVLLLTATPEQAGMAAHFARLQLLDPDRFHNFAEFQTEQAKYRALAPKAEILAQQQDKSALDELLDSYGTGRVMFRNSRSHIGGFPQRHLKLAELEGEDSLRVKLEWLIQLLKTHKNEKFVLICRSAELVMTLHELLRVQQGLHAAVFHEGLSLLERDRAAAYFASPEDGCPILLCSEIGSEGRNFQFAQHLILFDLPSHPDLLEQRIGRLDRIGQQHAISIHLPVVANSAEQIVYRWYQAMAAFEQTNAIGATLYQEFAPEVERLIDDQLIGELEPEALDDLVSATKARAQQLRADVEAGRDRLQELNAFRPHQMSALLKDIEALEQADELVDFMQAFWARFGIDYDRLNEHSGWLRPTEQMRTPLSGLPEEGITVTFSRRYALSHEHVTFLSWDHPLVQQALELLTQDSYGSTAVGLLQNRALPAGAWFIELHFSSQVMAPQSLMVNEFYPRQSFRVLLDSQARDLSAKVAPGVLAKQLQFIDKKQARLLLKQLRTDIQLAIKTGWKPAEAMQQQAIATACEKVTQQLDGSYQRLVKLSERNPLVRDSELIALKERQSNLLKAIQEPLLQLDSACIMVNLPA